MVWNLVDRELVWVRKMSRYQELSEFITRQMRMSHIYQPVMLIELLGNHGHASVNQIARSLLLEDRSQIEYYEHITRNMVGRVLTRNRGVTRKDGDVYSLNGFPELSAREIDDLIQQCLDRMTSFLGKRGDAWSHRRRASGYISGTLRYEILKRAKFRCELCGISADKKALEVDHIIPRAQKGSDDESNLQALCYSCNSMKRDRDATDFRGIAESYGYRETGCIFCEPDPDLVIAENELCYARKDGYPVTESHTLIIPKRHVPDYFALHQPEINAIHRMIQERKAFLEGSDDSITGFNVGVNSGTSAGQTIGHAHVHLIPRRDGDIDDPRGGVRGVIPEMQNY